MEATQENHWLDHMANIMACEILDEMAQIPLTSCESRMVPESTLDTVCSHVDGDYEMELTFRAEPKFFYRLTENMTCGTPDGPEEVQEYAMEFFNTLCGRFISEVYRATRVPARFSPVHFLTAGERCTRKSGPFNSICFMSDRQEYAEFSWSEKPMEELLRRNGIQ